MAPSRSTTAQDGAWRASSSFSTASATLMSRCFFISGVCGNRSAAAISFVKRRSTGARGTVPVRLALKRALGAKVVAEVADVRQYEALQAAMAKCRGELGPIDVLVCGAAGNFPIPAEKLSPNGFKSVVDIDLLGSFNSCRAAFDQLSTTRGCIIFISAGMSFLPYPYQVHVGAAKAGVDNLMKNLALEWGKYGIRSNSIVPGPIEGTEGVKRLGGEAWAATQQNSIPLGRFGTVDDIARAAVFLASPLASYVTGTVLVVDGGQNLAGSASFASAIEAMQAQQQQ